MLRAVALALRTRLRGFGRFAAFLDRAATPPWLRRGVCSPNPPNLERSRLDSEFGAVMEFDKILEAIAQAEADIEAGPITPNVAPAEIRSYLASRYDFKKPLALDEVSADVERMLRKWQVQVTHPRYLGLFNPSVTRA